MKPTANTSTHPAHPDSEAIARRAYEIWLQNGCPHGRDVEHWCEAERELIAAHTAPAPNLEDRAASSRNRPRKNPPDAISPKLDDVDSPYSGFQDEAPFPAKVERQLRTVGRSGPKRSPTSAA